MYSLPLPAPHMWHQIALRGDPVGHVPALVPAPGPGRHRAPTQTPIPIPIPTRALIPTPTLRASASHVLRTLVTFTFVPALILVRGNVVHRDDRSKRRGGKKASAPPPKAPTSSSGSSKAPAAAAAPSQGYESLLGGLETLNLGGSTLLPSAPAPVASNGFPSLASAPIPSTPAVQLPKQVLLSHVTGGGLQVEFRFLRRPSIHGKEYSTMEVYLTNHLPSTDIHSVKLSESVRAPCFVAPPTDR